MGAARHLTVPPVSSHDSAPRGGSDVLGGASRCSGVVLRPRGRPHAARRIEPSRSPRIYLIAHSGSEPGRRPDTSFSISLTVRPRADFQPDLLRFRCCDARQLPDVAVGDASCAELARQLGEPLQRFRDPKLDARRRGALSAGSDPRPSRGPLALSPAPPAQHEPAATTLSPPHSR
jgi:hypothetical protein